MKKVKYANCGASVKAANGGYMQVGQAKKGEGTGYNKGGMVEESKQTKEADRSKYAKRAEGVKANCGGYMKKKKKSKK